jgi:hypothetical protein
LSSRRVPEQTSKAGDQGVKTDSKPDEQNVSTDIDWTNYSDTGGLIAFLLSLLAAVWLISRNDWRLRILGGAVLCAITFLGWYGVCRNWN